MYPLIVAATLAATLSWPVDSHEVVRAFDPPAALWGAGHRGIDIAASAGDPVLAPADGTVWFAGVVVDRPLLSIDIGAGTLVSMEPVEPLVARGDLVVAGQVIGTLVAGHEPCGECLHLGVRVDGVYVNPLLLLGVERAVLLPLELGIGEPNTGELGIGALDIGALGIGALGTCRLSIGRCRHAASPRSAVRGSARAGRASRPRARPPIRREGERFGRPP